MPCKLQLTCLSSKETPGQQYAIGTNFNTLVAHKLFHPLPVSLYPCVCVCVCAPLTGCLAVCLPDRWGWGGTPLIYKKEFSKWASVHKQLYRNTAELRACLCQGAEVPHGQGIHQGSIKELLRELKQVQGRCSGPATTLQLDSIRGIGQSKYDLHSLRLLANSLRPLLIDCLLL